MRHPSRHRPQLIHGGHLLHYIVPSPMPARRFNIAIATPPGFEHSVVFFDLARLLQLSLQTLGHDAKISYGQVDDTATNIALGYHLIGNPAGVRDLIVYQLEPL